MYVYNRWELIVDKCRVYKNVTYYEGYSEPYLSIDAIFVIKRKPPPEIEATRNPCILIMFLILSIFWMPPNSSKKLLVGGIAFLSLIILLVYVAWSTRYPLGVLSAGKF